MDTDNIKHRAVNGFFWQLLQRVFAQLVSFSVSVVLARLLMPNDYGTVALASMFIVLTCIFLDGGMGLALIQRKDIDDRDYNTVFYTSLAMSFVLYAFVYFTVPLFARWFHNSQLIDVVRLAALTMPLGSLSIVQNAIVNRQLNFRKLFISSLAGTVVSAVISLWMAYSGYGIWALVAQSMISTVINTAVMFFIVKWRPRLYFSVERFKTLFSFGWKMTAVNLFNTFFRQLKGYVIGLKYTPSDLAYYNRGEGLPGILYNNINGAINTVMLPTLANLQNDMEALRRAMSRAMRVSSFFLMPSLFGLAAISDNIIPILYTEKWAPAIPFMQVICFISCTDILGQANYQALVATGKAKTVLYLEFIKRPFMLALIVATMFISPLAIAVGQLVYSISAFLINAFPNRKYIHYPIREQLADISKSLITALLMALAVYMFGLLPINRYVSLCIQVAMGAGLYVGLAWMFNKEDCEYIKVFLKERLQKPHA